MDLDRHWHPAVIRDPAAGPSCCALGLGSPVLVGARRVLGLIVERGQVLPVLDHHRRLVVAGVAVASELLWIDLVALLVLRLLVL